MSIPKPPRHHLNIRARNARCIRRGKCAPRKQQSASINGCEVLTKIGVLSHADHAGLNAFGFSGIIGAYTLIPGTYLLTVTASVPGVPPSAPAKTTFQVAH